MLSGPGKNKNKEKKRKWKWNEKKNKEKKNSHSFCLKTILNKILAYFGLTHPVTIKLLEELPGAKSLSKYQFKGNTTTTKVVKTPKKQQSKKNKKSKNKLKKSPKAETKERTKKEPTSTNGKFQHKKFDFGNSHFISFFQKQKIRTLFFFPKTKTKIDSIKRDSNGKPILPIEIGTNTILDLGKISLKSGWHTTDVIIPVGFRRYRKAQKKTKTKGKQNKTKTKIKQNKTK